MDPWWTAPLREAFAGRDVIVAGGVPAAWGDHVDQLRSAGARSVLVLATEGRGAGEGPDVPTVVIEAPLGLSMMDRLRFGIDAVGSPPDDVVRALDEFDPDRTAVVVGSFLNEASELAGRPLLAHRRAEWLALEDKVVVDALWDRAGVDRLPSAVCPVEEASARATDLDLGAGTVWAADARDGFHGGGAHTHRVVDAASQRVALDRLHPVCDRVRVMPFVEGIACSIHGIVLPDGVVALRPVEMITLRRGSDLVYAGCASFWDPPDETRDRMREAARRVGRLLAREVGFRGAFTVDGVVDRAGFWPTELNPRYGAGLSVLTGDDVPVLLLNDLIVAGRALGPSAGDLERELLDRADGGRSGGTWIPGVDVEHPRSGQVAYNDGAWRWSRADEQASGTVISAPGFVRCSFEPATVPVGPSVGPLAVRFWSFADDALGTRLSPLAAAPDPTR